MPSPEPRVVRSVEHRVVPWKNGRGTTTELAVEPAGAAFGSFTWRLSAAAVVEDGPFSSFPELDRTLVLLPGPSSGRLVLVVDGVERTLAPGDRTCFPGDVPTVGRVPDGPVRDLNWMVRRGVPHSSSVESGSGVTDAPSVLVPLEAPLRWGPEHADPLEVLVAPAGLAWASAGRVFVGRLRGGT